jgi:hypothetical protein
MLLPGFILVVKVYGHRILKVPLEIPVCRTVEKHCVRRIEICKLQRIIYFYNI